MDKKDLVKTLLFLENLLILTGGGEPDADDYILNINKRTKSYKLLKEVFEEFSRVELTLHALEKHVKVITHTINPLDLIIYGDIGWTSNYKLFMGETEYHHFRRFELYKCSLYNFYCYLRIFIISILQKRIMYNYEDNHFFLNSNISAETNFLRHSKTDFRNYTKEEEKAICLLLKMDTKKFVENVVECMKEKGLISG